jgi:hypothetical protein
MGFIKKCFIFAVEIGDKNCLPLLSVVIQTPDKLSINLTLKITIMEKTIQTQEVLTVTKTVYEIPSSQVYELKVEGAILQASGEANPSDYGYDENGGWY